jgi:hypothetical protein
MAGGRAAAGTADASVKRPNARERRRAILRLLLGQSQMVGATATLILVIQQGVTPTALWGATISGLITLVSLVLFRVVWRDHDRGKQAL